MQQADFDYKDFQNSSRREMNKNLLVKFYIKTVPDKARTAEEGRPMYKDIEYIDVRVVGKKEGVARPVRVDDLQDYPEHYDLFKKRIEAPIVGTPLTEWPPISRSICETLAFLNVKTVEQLAELSDTACSQVMGAQGFKRKAQDYIKYAAETKDLTDRAELARENQELKESMKAMMHRIESLEGSQVKDVTEPVNPIAMNAFPVSPVVEETPEEEKRRINREYQQKRRAAKKAAKE